MGLACSKIQLFVTNFFTMRSTIMLSKAFWPGGTCNEK